MPARLTNSKTFWAASALLSLFILAASAWSLYDRVSLYFSEDTFSVSPKPVPLPKFEEEEEGEKAPEEKPAAKAPEQKPAPVAPAPKAVPAEAPAKSKAVKTSFEYKGQGKSVTIAGSFSVWREIKMTRKNGSWRADVYILPGTYTYHFTVDGKKTADPGKPKAPTGDSIVTVE